MASRILTIGAVGALLVAGWVGFSSFNDGVTAQSDEDASGAIVLHRGNGTEPSTLDLHRSAGTWENNIIGDMFLGLYTEDPFGSPVFGVANSHTISDDGLVHTFTLREDEVWSDGVALTASDFVFALNRILDPEMGAEYASLLYLIENAAPINAGEDGLTLGVTAIDDHTLEIRLERPAPFLPQLLTHYTTFAVPQHVVLQHGDSWSRAGNMVSNGAYVLTDWVPNDHVRVVKNERFFDAENVQIEEIYYYPTDDGASALRRFRAGELDLNTDFPIQQNDWLLENMPQERRVAPFIVTSYIAVNVQEPPFDDIRIRQALAMAIDRDVLAHQIMGIGQEPAYTLVPPLIPDYTPARAFFADWSMERRIEEARTLMRAAGYGPDNPLQFEYRYRESIDNRRLAVATAAFWAEIFADASLINTETATHYDDLQSGNFQLGDAGWVADFPDAENYLFLLDSNSGLLNYGKYNNPEYDALLAQAAATADLYERAEILASAEAILMEELPLFPTIYGVSRNIIGAHVIGWEDNPVDIHRTRYLTIDESARAVQPNFADQIMRWFN